MVKCNQWSGCHSSDMSPGNPDGTQFLITEWYKYFFKAFKCVGQDTKVAWTKRIQKK